MEFEKASIKEVEESRFQSPRRQFYDDLAKAVMKLKPGEAVKLPYQELGNQRTAIRQAMLVRDIPCLVSSRKRRGLVFIIRK